MLAHLRQWFKNNPGVVWVIAMSFFLLLFRIKARNFWMDETMVLSYLRLTPWEFIREYFGHPDNHPPLYYFLVLLLSKVFLWTELTIRLLSVLSGVGTVIVTYFFAKRLLNDQKWAVVVAGFTAMSAYFVLISQMARYHSFAALVSLLALYFFYQLYNGGDAKSWWLYLSFFAAVGWIDYPHFIYLGLITNVVYVGTLLRRRPITPVGRWVGGQILVALTFLPMMWLLYHRIFIQGDGGFSNVNLLANSWIHIIAGIFFHGYVFIFSENILPWNYFWFLTGCLSIALALFGLVKVSCQSARGGVRFVAGIALSMVTINTFFMNFANPRYNFTVYPKFGFVAYPLCVIALVAGIRQLRTARMRFVALGLWGLVAIYGLVNFYQRTNYLNPSYFNTFTSLEYVRDRAQEGQYLAITPDAGLGLYEFYKKEYFSKLKPLLWSEIPFALTGTKVWFFATGSDAPDRSVDPLDIVPSGYRIIERIDSVPLDPEFKKFKEKVLHRPSYTFKYSLFLLEKV